MNKPKIDFVDSLVAWFFILGILAVVIHLMYLYGPVVLVWIIKILAVSLIIYLFIRRIPDIRKIIEIIGDYIGKKN